MLKALLRYLQKVLTKEQPDIVSASVVMMVLITFSKILGLLTKMVAVPRLGAERFGIFVAANTLPEILSNLLIFGTITSVMIPILVEVHEKDGKASFGKLFSSIVNAGLLVFIFSSIVIGIFAGEITPFFIDKIARPAVPYSAADISEIVSMLRFLLIPQIILGVSSLLTTALNALKRFTIPQIAPIFYNLGVLFGALLIPLFHWGAWGLVWGILFGSILHLAVQIPLGLHLKLNYRFTIDISSTKLREIFTIALPRIIALSADQIAIAVDRGIAIGLGAAALGAYYLAVSIVSMPFSLFTNTFSIAALPHLSTDFARKNIVAFKETFINVFNQILFFTVPISMILLVLRLPLVRLIYGLIGTQFTWENTLMVSWVVFFFSIGLVPEVMGIFLNRTFYAIHDTLRPLLVGTFVVIGGIVTGILFSNYLSHFDVFSLKALRWDPSFFFSKGPGVSAVGGLALSSSLIYSISFFLLLILLVKRIGRLDFHSFWIPMFRKFLFGIIMALFMYILFKVWSEVLDTAKAINVFILTMSTIIPGGCLYLWLLYIFRDTEFNLLTSGLASIRSLKYKLKAKAT